MSELARCNGRVLLDEGGRLVLVEQGGGWLGTALFVTALIAGLGAVNGVAMLFMAGALAGVVVLAIAALVGVVAWRLWTMRRRARSGDRAGTPCVVFDLDGRALRDPGGAQLAALADVSLERVFQIGSSSKALVARFPGGEVMLGRGTPFGDSVDDLERALRARYSFSS